VLKVKFQEILSDVVKDARVHGEEVEQKILKVMISRITVTVEHASSRLADGFDMLKVNFFNAIEDCNKIIRDLIVEKTYNDSRGVL
jgi:hypothetical protein